MKDMIIQYWNWFVVWIIVFFGAIVHATAQLKIARDTGDDSFTFLDWVILIPIAGFAGMIFAIAASLFTTDVQMVNFAAGIGAFLGIKGLNKISAILLDILRDRLGK